MKLFSQFKNVLKCSNEQLEKLTGYTPQGLRFTFNKMDTGVQPQRRFLVCINSAITEKIREETERHEARLRELRELQAKLIGDDMVQVEDEPRLKLVR